ncbi:ABC transporter substrate-binding protein [Vreelandella zhanjiangensis]|uniref:ABC transporter substrate-binding protein n=1 Tax=Vreelandella zhanjiangensis TaxID=1121960 RepID=UPI0003790BFF|nr:ABC transporter substrate-binding protein [Halomonas zhanjiangensis]
MRKLKILILMGVLASPLAQAELKFGIVAPETGGAASMGLGMQEGINAYFAEINAAGGVNGQPLTLVARDDRYNPLLAAQHTRELSADESILAAIGNVGTPTAAVTVTVHNQQQMLLFGAFTGAGLLRQSPPDRYIINYRASYAEETATMINGLLEAGIAPEEIAFFTQNDSFGDAGYYGAISALHGEGFEDTDRLVHGRFTRGTRNIHQGLATILQAPVPPRAIIIVSTFGPAADFIREARKDLEDVLFLNVSFVGSQALVDELGDMAEGVMVTQVVPPLESTLPAVESYHAALKHYASDAEPSFISLEGYLAAKLFVEGLKSAGEQPDRESIVDGLLSLGNIDIGLEEPLMLNPDNHQASHAVWPTIIRNGHFEPVNWSSLTP